MLSRFYLFRQNCTVDQPASADDRYTVRDSFRDREVAANLPLGKAYQLTRDLNEADKG